MSVLNGLSKKFSVPAGVNTGHVNVPTAVTLDYLSAAYSTLHSDTDLRAEIISLAP